MASHQATVVSPGVLETAELSGDELTCALAEVEDQRQRPERQRHVIEQQQQTLEQLRQTTEHEVLTQDPAGQDTIDLRDLPDPRQVSSPPPTFSVASKAFTDPEPRPTFETTRSPSVVDPLETSPSKESHNVPPSSVGAFHVEVASISDQEPTDTTTPSVDMAQPIDFAPVHIPPVGLATARDKIVAVVLFCSGVAMVVGTFLDWTVGAVIETGWERGDGLIVIIAGIVGASMAGPIGVGIRHVVPKALPILAGVVTVAVLGLVAVTQVFETRDNDIDFGIGFFVVLAGSILMIVAGVADQGDELVE